MTWKLTDQSLCQFRGVTLESERAFRELGIKDSEALIRYLSIHGPVALLKRISSSVSIFQCARRLGITDIIVNMFPIGARTRIISDRFERTLFFDVETDNIGTRANVTLIACVMNGFEHVFVRNIDLHEFLNLWSEAEVIVSFNGKRFDVPVLMREFGISRIPAHIDLMDESRHFGLNGGLKEIEERIGFMRSQSDCHNGLAAIAMWQDYLRQGNCGCLDALKQYNLDDARSLVSLYQYLLPLASENIFDL